MTESYENLDALYDAGAALGLEVSSVTTADIVAFIAANTKSTDPIESLVMDVWAEQAEKAPTNVSFSEFDVNQAGEIEMATLGIPVATIFTILQSLGYAYLFEEALEWLGINKGVGFTNWDDGIQEFLSTITGGVVPADTSSGRLSSLQELGLVDGNGAATKKIGATSHGFTVKSISVYVRGQRQSKNVWYKPKRLLSPAERMASAQGRREQKVSDKKYWGRKNTASYKRGLAHGKENMRKEMLMYGRGNVYQTGG